MTPPKKVDKRFSVGITNKMDAELKEIASRRGIDIAELMREYLQKGIDEEVQG
jgi:predicted DNA-binding protein